MLLPHVAVSVWLPLLRPCDPLSATPCPLNVSHTNVLSLSFSLSLGLVLVWLHLRLHLYCELSRHSKLYPLTGRSAAATATATAIAAFLRRKWKSRLIRLQKFNILCIKLYGRHSLSLSLSRFSCVWRKEAAWMHKIFLVVCFGAILKLPGKMALGGKWC